MVIHLLRKCNLPEEADAQLQFEKNVIFGIDLKVNCNDSMPLQGGMRYDNQRVFLVMQLYHADIAVL